ncbi:hypothetical protein NDU88_007975 [Pleurodeles waltl]|uniref:ribonuclease H n=1 Tax=Pleurodeles waltl TaxID=8319 RepID=A0AAV7N3L8_PLEWA|nr:hypothetical protein NDU88_007975 [Pleurodeles waltl]
MLLATDDAVEEESEPLPDLLSAGEKDGSVEGVILSPSLTEEQQKDCRHVLGQFALLFSLIPGVTHLCTHDVDTGDSTPVKHKVYRLTDRVRACIKEEVSKMLTLGVIEHFSSPWASPVVLVPKAAAPGATPELRFCVDYQGLNAVSKTDAHPIPRADELIDRLGAAKYLSTFDLTSGYWQIALTEGAKERSAFSTPDGHFHFNVMPFGMKNAPATFQRLVNQVLAGLDEFSAAYLDDIAVFSSTWEGHLQHLWRVLEALQKAGLTIKASKCQIGQGSVVYLGHQVGSGQVAPLQPKIDTILAWEPPKTQTEMRAFLGLTGYYRRFVKGYGTIVTPLTELTSKKQPKKVIWTEACQNAFDALKAAMCTAPVLKAPDYSKEFVVQTDASEHGIGAVLSQLNEEGLDQPVAFISRRLLPREHRDSNVFSLPAPGVSGETPALTSGALSSPWALERKAGRNPRKSTSDDYRPTLLLNPVTPPAPDAVTFAGTRRSSQARRRCSPAEVRDSVEVAAPRRDRRHPKCVDSTFRTDAAIPDFAHRLVFTLHQRYCTLGSTRLRVRRRWCWLVGNDSVTTQC